MIWKLIFSLLVSISASAEAKCTPQGCACASPCRPACASLPPSAPVLPIMIDNCGPSPNPLPPINCPPIQTPLVNRPTVTLPSCAPPPKTLGNSCHCVKTVVKPQVVQQLITVPTIQRYIQTTHTPVVENIHYHGVPINCPPYAPEPPAPAAPCAAAAPPPPPAAPKPLALSQLLALAALKPPCAPPAAPPAMPSALLALLSSLRAAAPPCAPPALPPCLPPCPPPCPPPCLPPAAPALPACLSLAAPAPPPPCLPPCAPIPPCLLSLLSKLL